MKHLPYAELKKGTLMVATPEIEKGLFFRSVILLCEHSPSGSFGLVINKSLELEIPDEIVSMDQLANPNVSLRAGGPVQTNQMMLLHSCRNISNQTLEICPNVHLGGDLQFLQETIMNEEGSDIFLCFGYAGWGGGQLEREFLDGQWLLASGRKELIFSISIEKIWQNLLKEMGGKYATLSMIPEDLSLN